MITLGSKVKLLHDDGWGSPGCVMSLSGDRLHIYWPDENRFSDEHLADLTLYAINIASQPQEVVAA